MAGEVLVKRRFSTTLVDMRAARYSTIPDVRTRSQQPPIRVSARVTAVLAILLPLAAVAIASALAPYAPSVARDAELLPLLRFMAGVKGLMVTVALALVVWRSQWPLRVGTAVAYMLACTVATVAVALIAQPVWVGPAALAFHAAELGFLVTAWRDGHGGLAGALLRRSRAHP